MLDQLFVDAVRRTLERAGVDATVVLEGPARAAVSVAGGADPFAFGLAASPSRELTLYFAVDQRLVAPSSVVRLGSALGKLEPAHTEGGRELRVWSPYRYEDFIAARRQAAVWAASAAVAAARALAYDLTFRGGPAARSGDARAPGSDGADPSERQRHVEAPQSSSGHPDGGVVQVAGGRVGIDETPLSGAPIGEGRRDELTAIALADMRQRLDVLIEESRQLLDEVRKTSIPREDLVDDWEARLRPLLEGRSAGDDDPSKQALEALRSGMDAWEGRAREADERARALELEIEALRASLARKDALERSERNDEGIPDGRRAVPPSIRPMALSDTTSATQLRAEVLRWFVSVGEDDLAVREALADILAERADYELVRSTLQGFESSLSPAGAARLVEAQLAQRLVPSLDLCGRVDWSRGQVAGEFRRTVDWMAPGSLIEMGRAMGANWPPGASGWLASLSMLAKGEVLASVFDLWAAFDEVTAGEAVVAWVGERRCNPVTDPWCRDALELVSIENGDRRVAIAGIRYLLEAYRASGDESASDRILSRARSRLAPRDWLTVGHEWAVAEFQVSPAGSARLVSVLADLIALAEALKSSGERDRLVAVARELGRRAAPDLFDPLVPVLRGADDRERRPVDESAKAITSVADAVAYAKARYPTLLMLKEAEESARQRGSAGTKQTLESLQALGEWSAALAADGGAETWDRLRQLPGYREDVSDTAKQAFRRFYERQLDDGTTIQLGPHLDAGGGAGRIYFYVDRDARRVVVGHVGKHLPGKRDT